MALNTRPFVLQVTLCVAMLAAQAVARPQQAATQTADGAALAATPGAALPMDPKVRVRTLPNGLRYYLRANARPEKRAELRLVVNVGSIVEDDDQLGLAHVLEHMAFNGTRRFAKQEIVQFIERAGMRFGADLNAGTGFDETIYQLQLPSDTGAYIGRALDWFADIAGGGITLDSAELAKERPVVVEEWRLGRGAGERIQQQHFPVLFRGSRYATRFPIGTRESLERFTRAELTRFYQDWYRPELMAVVAVGDFNEDSVEALIVERFSAIPKSAPGARPRENAVVPSHTETHVAVATDAEASESNVAIIWKQPPATRATVADYQRNLARELFLDMLNARFGEIVRRPDAPFADAGGGQGRLVRSSDSFWLSAVVDEGRIERGLSAMLVEVERVRRFGFTESELARHRAELMRTIDGEHAERDKTTSATFAERYAEHYLSGEIPLAIELRAPLAHALAPTVSLAQVNALTASWFTDENRVVLASSPAKSGVAVPNVPALRGAIARARTAAVTPYDDGASSVTIVPAPPAPGRIVAERTLDAIGVTEWTLSNGVRVLIKRTDFQADEILIAGVSVGGVGGLGAERYYSARLGPTLLERGGAGGADATALTKYLSGKRAAVSADVDDRTESVSGQAAPRDLETFFQLAWARTQLPRLDTAAIVAFKDQYSAMLRSRVNDPAAAYSDTVGATMSQGHPLGRPLTDSIMRSLDARVALEVFRERFSDFSDFTFVVVGAVDLAELRPAVEKWVASLPATGRTDLPRDPGIRPPTGRITKTVFKGVEPKAQTVIILTGTTAWTRDVQLRAAAVNEIVDVRLRELLREDLGGTYGVGFGTGVSRWPVEQFTTSISFGAAPGRVDSLANVALGVLRKFAAEGPTDAELAKARENFLRGHETALKQNQFWMGLLQTQVLWGDDAAESLATYAERVRALDRASLHALARTLFDETNTARFTLMPGR